MNLLLQNFLDFFWSLTNPYEESIILWIILENTVNVIDQYAPEQEPEDPDEICPICRDNFGDKLIRTLSCGHSFCSICIVPWLSNHVSTCPTCRTQFP
jgi:hypothetical protein